MKRADNKGDWRGLDCETQLPRYRAIAGVTSRAHSVLDVGSGAGELAKHLRARYYVGVEPNPVAAREAAARGLHVVNTPAEDFESIRTFDAVVFSESLYYSPDPVSLLSRYTGFLAPGGVMVVTIFMRKHRHMRLRKLARAVYPKMPPVNRHCAELVDGFFAEHPRLTIKHIAHPGTHLVWRLWSAKR